ncbi:MAG: hypothetical protein AB8G18_17455 [Gammaproteobacteria bacterium]
MKILGKILGAAAALTSVSALAHPGHEHHALQSSAHYVADSMMAVGAVVVAVLIVRALLRRNES